MEAVTRSSGKLGAMLGVFIPNFLQMMGVVFFLRMGWILGHVGTGKMLLIILISSSVLILTSFSLSSIVSNMKVEGGGAYFLISRLLGIEFGTSIGLMLGASQVCVIALCVSGFAQLITGWLPTASILTILITTLVTLGIISSISARLAALYQLGIFIALMGALISIFSGGAPQAPLTADVQSAPLPFWAAFALFFPATTGIETGVSLSDDLKDPKRALSRGTPLSVIMALLTYLAMTLFLSHNASSQALQSDLFIAHKLSRYSPLVTIGVCATLLSSALSGIMGTPRILEALSHDRIVPQALQNRPLGTILTLTGALLLSFTFDLSHLIPLLTMVFLLLYGLMNFVAFFQSFLGNPSWRPSIAISWPLPLLACAACLFLMFMVNPGAAFSVLLAIGILGSWVARRDVGGNWDDMRHSLFSFFVHKGAAKLAQLTQTPRSWRPNLLVLTGPKDLEPNLAYFTHALDHGKGFLTFHATQTRKHSISRPYLCETLKWLNIPSFTHVNTAPNWQSGALAAIHNYGFGPLTPNTLVATFDASELSALAAVVDHAEQSGKNLILLKHHPSSRRLYFEQSRPAKQINLWWRGQNQRNFELSLALSYSLRASATWSGARLCIKSIISSEAKKKKLIHVFQRYQEKMRLGDVLFEPIIDPDEKFFDDLISYSEDADFTFLGFRGVADGQSEQQYTDYLDHLNQKTKDLPNFAFVLARQELDFLKIFE